MKTPKVFSFTILLLALIGCGSFNESSISVEKQLIGSWSYIYPNQCEEINTFNSDGTWSQTALDEISSGTFEFVEDSAAGKHPLAVNIIEDNGLADCQGESKTKAGSVSVYATFPTEKTMNWYLSESDESPAITVTKKTWLGLHFMPAVMVGIGFLKELI
jgi:hypothetical protein